MGSERPGRPRWAAKISCDPRAIWRPSWEPPRRLVPRLAISKRGWSYFRISATRHPRLPEIAACVGHTGAGRERATSRGMHLQAHARLHVWRMSPGSAEPSTLANALLTKVSGGAANQESASGQEGAIGGPLSAASYSQPRTLPPACSPEHRTSVGSGGRRGAVLLSRPPCSWTCCGDSAASLSRL